MKKMIALSVVVILLIGSIGPGVRPVQATNHCEFKLGFKALYDQIAGLVGTCLSHELHDPNTGNTIQSTKRLDTGAVGLMVWRKADNWTAWTDGSTSWINGPYGLMSRPNQGPLFPWEAAAPSARPAAPPPQPAPAAPPTPGFNPGQTITSGSWRFTNIGWYRDSVLPNSPSPQNAKLVQAKGVFILVKFTATNLAFESAGLPRFKLRDQFGRVFDEDGLAGLYGSYKYGGQSGYIARIQPSLTETVVIAFDVAPDAPDNFTLLIGSR